MERPPTLDDAYGRPLRNLRLSVTDRCNLRCHYCMPEEEYAWLPQSHLLRYEELSRLVDAFCDLGVDKVRLTGGEPLLRRDLPALVELLGHKPRLTDLALTTNGVLLGAQAEALRRAGLHRLTVSLDTLQPARFFELTRRHALGDVLDGLAAAAAAGFGPLKLDAVMMKGLNDDELFDLLEFAGTLPAELRFIEYMDVGGATRWSPERVLSRAEMLQRLTQRYGPIAALDEPGPAPAARYRLGDGRIFGIISSTTQPFCRACDRSRLTADGRWYLCLYAPDGLDLAGPLRAGATSEALAEIIRTAWRARRDRGAEERLASDGRAPLVSVSSLKRDLHLEMHTRGG